MSVNHHGSLILTGDRGIFITGRSGSGKTGLALALLRHCVAHGHFGRLVADDQVFLFARNGRLIGRAPAAISGLVEARGFGPALLDYEPAAVIDLLVELAPAQAAPRYQEIATTLLENVEVPTVRLAEHNTDGAIWAIAAHLSLPPFGPGVIKPSKSV